MRDAIVLALSVALPWVSGALAIRAAMGRSAQPLGVVVGYGYPGGLFAITLIMRALSLVDVRWNVAWIAVPMVLIAVAAYLRLRSLGIASIPRHALRTLATPGGATRAIFVVLLVLTCVRVLLLAVEVMLIPLVPIDAFAQWASKSRVWYEYGWMTPFVPASQWATAYGAMVFTDTHPDYPGTVPLFQVWTALCLGRWDESLINVPWIAAAISLGIAFYAQLRRLEISSTMAMFGTYLLLSLPFLTIHVAIAGVADLFVAIGYGLAAIAMWQWTLTRQRSDAALAILMALICASVKVEGSIWVLTLVPGVITALNRRFGLTLVGAVAAIAILYLAFGPAELRMLGYTLRTSFTDVSKFVYEHMFVMDNWHLLWYAVIGILVFRARTLFDAKLAPMTVTMLAAVAFIGVVFFFSTASGGVKDESLTNRLIMHTVVAFVFYVALILRSSQHQANTAPLYT